MNPLQHVGRRALDVFAAWGHGALFFWELIMAVPAGLDPLVALADTAALIAGGLTGLVKR